LYSKVVQNSKIAQKWNLKLLVIIAAGFQLWDALLTHKYVGNGYISEGNPLMALLIKSDIFLLEKVISVVISVLLIYLLSRFSAKIAARSAAGVIFLYSAVLIWNYALLFKA
jgi:hypothetical protein